MATLVFSAIGASIGGSLLGSVTGAAIGSAIGKAAGSLFGSKIDQMLFGETHSDKSTATARDSLKMTNSYVGQSVPQVFGRHRIAGQIIWASKVQAEQKDDAYTYKSSFAIALCEGDVHRVGRIWANNQIVHIDPSQYRFYSGSNSQIPDPLIANSVGQNYAPAFRNICYLVFENLELEPFGNAIPNLEFEVFRHAKNPIIPEIKDSVQAVSIIPGTGEYTLESDVIELDQGFGVGRVVNGHHLSGSSDFDVSMDQLTSDLPQVKSVSLIVSWFGNDLRCADCTISPKVEQSLIDGGKPWKVGDLNRWAAGEVSLRDGSSVYGGTPSDASVVSAIKNLRNSQKEVMFYPFILMDIPAENTRPDPWSDSIHQPVNPWRGRITLNKAPATTGSSDKTSSAHEEVDAFFGTAQLADFQISNGEVHFTGNDEWQYRRFILHNAYLCKLAGGVDEFLIGSELVGMTRIRDHNNEFPCINQLKLLAQDVRIILGADTKISYAADWSEYFGYHPSDEPGAVYFHLDPLWSDENIDFVGIDNYMPISDWRHADEHKDRIFGSVYAQEYLQANISGGEGYDWFYDSSSDRENQTRTSISDGHGEPWVWRFKDLQNWWGKLHYNRPEGVRASVPTDWVPQSKPIRFTEYGAAAIDLSTNEPNKFIDLHSSEASLPAFSDGGQDGFIQAQYIEAVTHFWNTPQNNPNSTIYDGQMLDMSKAYCWTYDARPWPEFPARTDVWADGAVFSTGHWLNERVNCVRLANVVAEICDFLGYENIDVTQLYGLIDGVAFRGDETAREKLELLMKAFQFDAFSSDRKLVFKSRDLQNVRIIDEDLLVETQGVSGVKSVRKGASTNFGRMELHFLDGDSEYLPATVQSIFPDRENEDRIALNFPIVMSEEYAKNLRDYYMWQSKQGIETIEFSLAKVGSLLKVGDIIALPNAKKSQLFRIDRIVTSQYLDIEATSFSNYELKVRQGTATGKPTSLPQNKNVFAQFLDLPIGNTNGLYFGAVSKPWVGKVECLETTGFSSSNLIEAKFPATIGRLQTDLPFATAGRVQPAEIVVELTNGSMSNFGTVYENIAKSPLAIKSANSARWELIGFADIERVHNQIYKIKNLYRGIYGTEQNIRNWMTGDIVAVVDTNMKFIPDSKMSDVDIHEFAFGPSGDQTYWKEQEMPDPCEVLKPLTPTKVRAQKDGNDTVISFVPRMKSDLDTWRDGGDIVSDQRFEVEITQQNQVVSSFETNNKEHRLQLPNGEFELSIRSIGSNGFKSNFVKEIINV